MAYSWSGSTGLWRTGGDPRTLAQLRHDVIASLLLHGALRAPATDGEDGHADPDGRGPQELAELVALIDGLPPVALEVITDASTLTGGAVPVCGACGDALRDPAGGDDEPGGAGATQTLLDPRLDGGRDGLDDGLDDGRDEPSPSGPGEDSAQDPPPPVRGTARGAVGLVMGPVPFFVSPGRCCTGC